MAERHARQDFVPSPRGSTSSPRQAACMFLSGPYSLGMVMGRLKQILMWVYALQLFLVIPWFLGSMYRDEQSIWVGTEFRKSMERFGASDTAFIVYLYALYYSAFLVIPYWILGFRYRDPVLRLLVSVWFAASAAIFASICFCLYSIHPIGYRLRLASDSMGSGNLLHGDRGEGSGT